MDYITFREWLLCCMNTRAHTPLWTVEFAHVAQGARVCAPEVMLTSMHPLLLLPAFALCPQQLRSPLTRILSVSRGTWHAPPAGIMMRGCSPWLAANRLRCSLQASPVARVAVANTRRFACKWTAITSGVSAVVHTQWGNSCLAMPHLAHMAFAAVILVIFCTTCLLMVSPLGNNLFDSCAVC